MGLIVLKFYHRQETGDTPLSLGQSLYQQLDWCKSRPISQFTELDLHGGCWLIILPPPLQFSYNWLPLLYI